MAQILTTLPILALLITTAYTSPLSFPDGSSSVHKNTVRQEETQSASVPESNGITAPPPPAATPEAEDEEPTVADLVNQVPQILAGLQSFLNQAINTYSNTSTALTNEPEEEVAEEEASEGEAEQQQPGKPSRPSPQLTQIIGLVDGFISATNSFAQQLLQPTPPEGGPDNVEDIAPVQENNSVGQ